ncbi:RING-H2 finger protein ATL13-like [Benincasa hispida]|uniref:RING-H2 finger protein ATL13-like n=1 Tax=Benincasa hispida TaxID=102211 RepID=UPI0019002A83|nr:RING-H2 finger protein ATL13-like [Benincasa hispida]
MATLSQPISKLPLPPPPLPETQADGGLSLDNEVSPTILLAIIILAIIFFFSGLLHLLLRFLHKPQIRTDPEDSAVDGGASAFQGQLRQLFHLHDAGVDQSFIDTLPVFLYKAIIGLKLDPFDCSVCLCEFQPNDKLRLLTKCSHAFHMDCIDTWLLTHSTCPLCRASLVSDFAAINGGFSSPIVGVLESASNSSREIGEIHTGSFLGFLGDTSNFTELKTEERPATAAETVVPIKLGKFRNLESNGEGSSNNGNVGSRRCFSMGSFGYVMDENSSLQVPIRTPAVRKPARKKKDLPLTLGNRAAISECDCESRREFNFNELDQRVESFGHGKSKESCEEKAASGGGDSDGVAVTDLARRAFSFHFPANWNRPRSENGMGMMDEENQRRNSLEFFENRPSFVRRTLQWLMGKNSNRIVHSSFTPNDDDDHS